MTYLNICIIVSFALGLIYFLYKIIRSILDEKQEEERRRTKFQTIKNFRGAGRQRFMDEVKEARRNVGTYEKVFFDEANNISPMNSAVDDIAYMNRVAKLAEQSIHYGIPDQNGDVLMPGCFDKALDNPIVDFGRVPPGLYIDQSKGPVTIDHSMGWKYSESELNGGHDFSYPIIDQSPSND